MDVPPAEEVADSRISEIVGSQDDGFNGGNGMAFGRGTMYCSS